MDDKLKIYKINKIFGSDLADQNLAISFKNEILSCLEKECDKVLLDFDGIVSITSDWSKVFLGSILLEKGFEFWSKKIFLVNHEPIRTNIIGGIKEVYDLDKKRLESLEKLSKLDQELGIV